MFILESGAIRLTVKAMDVSQPNLFTITGPIAAWFTGLVALLNLLKQRPTQPRHQEALEQIEKLGKLLSTPPPPGDADSMKNWELLMKKARDEHAYWCGKLQQVLDELAYQRFPQDDKRLPLTKIFMLYKPVGFLGWTSQIYFQTLAAFALFVPTVILLTAQRLTAQSPKAQLQVYSVALLGLGVFGLVAAYCRIWAEQERKRILIARCRNTGNGLPKYSENPEIQRKGLALLRYLRFSALLLSVVSFPLYWQVTPAICRMVVLLFR